MKTEHVPYLLIVAEEAVPGPAYLPPAGRPAPLPPAAVGGPLAGGAALNPRPLAGPIESALFGFHFPYLPDWLSDPTITGRDEAERIQSVLQRWVQFVANLWKWHNAAFSLRFLSHPERGAIEIALLARVNGRRGQAALLGQALAADLARFLGALGLPVQPLADHAALESFRRPFPTPYLLELRQHEEVVGLSLGDAYVVHPYWAPAGDWLLPFEALLQQGAAALVNVHLEPAVLFPEERDALARAASLAQTLSDFQYSGHYYQGRLADPQAGIIGRIYAASHKRLVEPFLLAVQVASSDGATAGSVARAFGAGICARPAQPTGDEERDLPSGFDMCVPRSEGEWQAAAHTLTELDLVAWGQSQAGPDKVRLPYLSDARGAAAAFRLPVALRRGVPGVATRQVAPAYDLGERRPAAARDELVLGTLHGGGVATIRLAALTQHGLIVGFTGTGKTNTCLSLLDQLWREQRIPFLVIEPAKCEYRGLLRQPGFADLLVFTLGDETVAPFRFNPFALQPGVRLEAHISALRACFDAALPQFGVLPMLVEESIHAVYAEKGWQLTDKGSECPERTFPTLRDMYQALGKTVETYAGELKQNLQAAASKRIGSLLIGSKGRMFNTQRGIPMDVLMGRPVVLELDSLNDDEKALAMMFVLMAVREYCKGRRGHGLQHVTLVEEAHRVMSNVAPSGDVEVRANTQAEGARAFAGMLAEIRAFGEGLLIAEQSPSKLVRDAVANTSLKIAHRLQDRHEREAIAAAMTMDEEQQLYLGRLPRGQAAVFSGEYEKATFMTVRPYKDEVAFDDRLADEVVAARMQAFRADQAAAFLPFDGCRFCASPCEHRAAVEPVTLECELYGRFRRALLAFEERPQPAHWPENWREVARVAGEAAARAGRPGRLDAAWCYLAHEIDFAFTEHMRRQFEKAFAGTGQEGGG